MNRDRAIRIVVSKLTGAAREKEILRLLTDPSRLRAALARPIHRRSRRRAQQRIREAKMVNFAVRLTPDEYLSLRGKAQDANLSLAAFIRSKTGV